MVAVAAMDHGRRDLARRDQAAVVVEDRVLVGERRGGVDLRIVGIDLQLGVAVLKPALGVASHCIGVRALSRPLAQMPASSRRAPRPRRCVHGTGSASRCPGSRRSITGYAGGIEEKALY